MGFRKTIIFKKINFSIYQIEEIANKIKNEGYSRNVGEGFVINEISDSVICATYVYTSLTFVTRFDEEKFNLVREKVTIRNIVDFSLDTNYNIIAIFSSGNLARRLLTKIGKLFDFEISIDDIFLNLDDVSNENLLKKIFFNVTSMRIRNFQINQEIIGTFSIKNTNHNIVKTLKQNYQGELVFVGGGARIRENQYNLGFYENGTVTINNSDDEFDEIFDHLKHALFKKEK